MSCHCTSNCTSCQPCGSCSCRSCNSCNCNCAACTDEEAENCAAVCTALEIENSWNIPACEEEAVLSVPGVTSVLIGAYIWNPTYGWFEITEFNSVDEEITVVNNCTTGNEIPGTLVPALTTFIFGSPPIPLDQSWYELSEPWTYASSTTVTVATGAADRYAVGDKVRYKQGGAYKYGYVIIVADQLLTITGGADYAFANANISDMAISRLVSPIGFPDWFNWTGTPTGFAAAPVGATYRFRIDDRTATVVVRQPTAGTSNATTFTLNAPVDAAVAAVFGSTLWALEDNSVALTVPGRMVISAGTITFSTTVAGAAWTAAGNKAASGTLVYQI